MYGWSDTEYDFREMAAARFDEDATCLQCGDTQPRWSMPNGICAGCRELNTLADAEELEAAA